MFLSLHKNKRLFTLYKHCTDLRRPAWRRRHRSDTERSHRQTETAPVWAPASPSQSPTLYRLKSESWPYDPTQRPHSGSWITQLCFKYTMSPISYHCSLLTVWPRRERCSFAHPGQWIRVTSGLAPWRRPVREISLTWNKNIQIWDSSPRTAISNLNFEWVKH